MVRIHDSEVVRLDIEEGAAVILQATEDLATNIGHGNMAAKIAQFNLGAVFMGNYLLDATATGVTTAEAAIDNILSSGTTVLGWLDVKNTWYRDGAEYVLDAIRGKLSEQQCDGISTVTVVA